MSRIPLVVLVVLAALVLAIAACKPSERRLCRVNDQCFVCSDDKSLAKCIRDPAAARCKWTPPETCRGASSPSPSVDRSHL